jgi:hypothetical protein
MKYELSPDRYRGESIKYVQNVMGNKKVVTASWPSNMIGKVLGAQGANKEDARQKIKKIIDNYKD